MSSKNILSYCTSLFIIRSYISYINKLHVLRETQQQVGDNESTLELAFAEFFVHFCQVQRSFLNIRIVLKTTSREVNFQTNEHEPITQIQVKDTGTLRHLCDVPLFKKTCTWREVWGLVLPKQRTQSVEMIVIEEIAISLLWA